MLSIYKMLFTLISTRTKNIFLNQQKVGKLLQKRADTGGVGISNNNTQIAAIALPPSTTHPQLWAELLTFKPKCIIACMIAALGAIKLALCHVGT